jgi:hypothetical protein
VEFTAGQEQALLRALRDVLDGHIGLRATVEVFDPMTDVQHSEVRVLAVACDRVPNGVPNADGAWWEPLIERGWLELVVSGMSHYRLSELGLTQINR